METIGKLFPRIKATCCQHWGVNIVIVSWKLGLYLVRLKKSCSQISISCYGLSFCSESFGPLLEQVVEGLTRHVSDDSPNVRRLCLRGLVQVLIFNINILLDNISWTDGAPTLTGPIFSVPCLKESTMKLDLTSLRLIANFEDPQLVRSNSITCPQ